ncbi:MAG TPA: hypothetical protein VFZ27_05680 [Terriglobia bacterium]|nr:hypothetical protein [Terriglobia bacterium]
MPSSELHPLARLLGGECPKDSDLGKIVAHLGKTLAGLIGEARILDFSRCEAPQVSILGPYFARGILEVGFSMLLARLDPFRVLVLRQVQQSPDYEVERRNSCALQWKGDFLPDEKVDENLWRPSRKPKDITRALLGDYHDHVFWRPSFVNMRDNIPEGCGGQWLSDLRLVSPDSFTRQIRSRAERAYTASSKGIHHEFVIPLAAYYDTQQILELLTEAIAVTSTLALVLNSGGHIPFCLASSEALTCFESIQEEVQEING